MQRTPDEFRGSVAGLSLLLNRRSVDRDKGELGHDEERVGSGQEHERNNRCQDGQCGVDGGSPLALILPYRIAGFATAQDPNTGRRRP
jgi:hypothetical protein